MSALTVGDILYGRIVVPSEYVPFLRIPEFLRLRGVRLSNLDSVEFKDLSGPTRWEHAIGVLHLADICSQKRGLSSRERAHLMLAALLHDIATPPFAHTAEYVLEDFDHERETARLLAGASSQDVAPSAAVYLSESPQFEAQCTRLSKELRVRVDVEEVARMVVGDGDLGFLISGSVDLDNADNVTRASHHMGFVIDPALPQRLAEYLATCDEAPGDLQDHDNSDVRAWAGYRANMYGAFFSQGSVERGREALLQHLFRRAVTAGVPRGQLIWNTDEGFLTTLETWDEGAHDGLSLRELVRRYRLLEDPAPIVTSPILTHEALAALSSPEATTWIEQKLTTAHLEAIVTVAKNRFTRGGPPAESVLPALGEVRIFKLGHGLTHGALPEWLRGGITSTLSGSRLEQAVARRLNSEIEGWVSDQPWLKPSEPRALRVRSNLDRMGDWAFRSSRNSSLHAYPSTFVQAIPGTLIHALGVSGQLIVDPFGGTGNTALEAVRAGGFGVSVDSNSIATLISRVRTSYLDHDRRHLLRNIDASAILAGPPSPAPELPQIERWHAPETIMELRHALGYVQGQQDPVIRDFLTLAFSAILTDTTGRRGRQHGFFADNTPLPKGIDAPGYADAIALLISRIRRNISILERAYTQLERDGEEAPVVLSRANAIQADCSSTSIADLGLAPQSAAAVITSPPYLCMSDYTLGHRLSYAWLGLDMATDFEHEIGPRRARLREAPEDSLKAYLAGMDKFAALSRGLLIPGGYLALVLASPTAKAFAESSVMDRVDELLEDHGFAYTWSNWRDISWARNHGYARLRKERVSVHQFAG